MGVYLNSKKPSAIYEKIVQSTYFIDKTRILEELIPVVEQPDISDNQFIQSGGKDIRYICVTRPRRFGKTVMASMIASFFGKGTDSHELFQKLEISKYERYEEHLNQHNVIHIMFNEMPCECKSYRQYIERIEKRLFNDLKHSFPDAALNEEDALWDSLNNIYELEDSVEFIFVFDEWDFIYHQDFITDDDKKSFTVFLSTLLKDQPYVEMAYMTGILPISKYSSGSELNMFCEYTMVTEKRFSDYFGFTDQEVDELFHRYQSQHFYPENVTREGLRIWYDGYHTKSGDRVYNPRSVVVALSNNNPGIMKMDMSLYQTKS